MKILIVLLSLLFFSYNINAQNKNGQDSLGKVLRQRLNQLPPVNDYSNPKSNIPQSRIVTVKTPKQIPEQIHLENTIVIIDNKIYGLASPEYVQLNISNLAEPVTIIEDKSSTTTVKKILIYKTKNNK